MTGSRHISQQTLDTLKVRRDFLAAARGLKHVAPGLILQARQRDRNTPADDALGAPRVGYTCSKKVGNAVHRNRAKRRLRAAAQSVLGATARPGWDYVLIGRAGKTIDRPFEALLDDLSRGVDRLHARADR